MTRVTIRTGIPGAAQAGDFTNATLQSDEGHRFDYSIATYLTVTDARSEDDVAEILRSVLGHMAHAAERIDADVRFEVEIGPYGDA